MRLAIPFLLVCGACSGLPAEPKNPFVLERPWGLATGTAAEEARALADVVDAARPVLVELPGFVDRPLRIHVAPRPLPNNWAGVTVRTDRGDAWVMVEPGGEDFAFRVAHELAHFYMNDLLDRLPPIVEEGFCEVVASRVHPAPSVKEWRVIVAGVSYLDRFTVHVHGPAAKAGLRYLVQEVPPIEVALELDPEELPGADLRVSDAYYGIGWVVADAIGLERLAELDARRESAGLDRVPAAWILHAAGLVPLSQQNLKAAVAHALGEQPGTDDDPLVITIQAE